MTACDCPGRPPPTRPSYANCTSHGRHRCDDVAVAGAEDALWYGRLVALARFTLSSGRPIEAVLVRWYEAAPWPRESAPTVTAATASAESAAECARRTRAALDAACPRLKMVFNMSWCSPESILRREAVVPDFATAPHPPADGAFGVGSTVFVNGFMPLISRPV